VVFVMKNENFFSISTTCTFDQLSVSRQREANSTAFQTAVNHLLTASDQPDRSTNRTKPPPCQPDVFRAACAT
jgi:hypothetical protein